MLKMFTSFLLVSTFVILATCDPYTPTEEEQKCFNEHNVTKEDMGTLFEDFKQESDIDRKFKCFTKCMFDIHGINDENGKMNVDKMLGEMELESDIATNVANDCKSKYESEEDGCEYAFNIMVCFTVSMIEEIKKHGST